MIQSVKKAFVVGMSAILLVGCSGLMLPTNYEDFHEKAMEINEEENPEIAKIRVKAEANDTKYNVAFNMVTGEPVEEYSEDENEFLAGALILMAFADVKSIENNEDYKYYVGDGFKVVTDKETFVWNKYGYLKEVSGKDDDGKKVSINYTYTYK